jgi:hypothetical protein
MEEGGDHVGAGEASGGAYSPWMVDGRAAGDVLASPRLLMAPSSPPLSRG